MEQTIYIHLHKAPPLKGKIFLGEIVFGETNDSSFRLSKFLTRSAKFVAITGLIFLFLSFAPSIWYSVKAHGIETISQLLAKPVVDETRPFNYQKDFSYQPKIDPSLPLEARITIPSIGVDAEIQESTLDNYEDALKKGIWRVPDFGTPYSRNKPTIVAAHRFGYLAWTNIFRRKNSFFNLPKLKEGEIVEIIWRQRRYVYEVYATEEGGEITDYSADLILYTCQSLTSPIRIFKYARLLEI
jgi:sortase (surface protein transpeptidase)